MTDGATARNERIATLEAEIRQRQTELAELRHAPTEIDDYELASAGGTGVRLSTLFDGHRDLIVIHNMGVSCSYCTLWADGFNGLYEHIRQRAGFVVVSPDSPVTQQAIASQRGWTFPMASNGASSFTEDMGFLREGADVMQPAPGVSTFHRRDDGAIERVAQADFGPGDAYCALWHLLDLLAAGADGWQPRTTYA